MSQYFQIKLIRKSLLTVIFILSANILNAQMCGVVLDSNTKQPVPFATITAMGFGTYADSLGRFTITENNTDTFLITSIGYFEKKVVLHNTNSCDTFYLAASAVSLSQIEVGNFFWLKNTFVDQISLKDIKQPKFSNNVVEGVTIIKFFPHPDVTRDFIISFFKVKVSQKSTEYQPRKVRIKIFEAKNMNEPGKDILLANDIFTIEKPSSEYIEFDLNRFSVKAPKSGYFIGIEFLTPKLESEGAGTFSVPGKTSKEFENGTVLIRYYSNIFRPFTFSSSQKVNVFFNTRLYEYK